MKLELEAVKAPTNDLFAQAIIATLTGYTIEEILVHLPACQRVRTSHFKETFHKLGYNCNNRFMKFDPETIHPCIMRCVEKGKNNGSWYCFAYYDKKVYYDNGFIGTFEQFISWFKDLRITSMLQVYL